MSTKIEPAVKSYFFGKGYTDFLALYKRLWNSVADLGNKLLGKIRVDEGFLSGFFNVTLLGSMGLGVLVGGGLALGAVAFVHLVMLTCVTVVYFCAFSAVFLAEYTYLHMRRFLTVCPVCHEKTLLPIYICDSCGEEHRTLAPNQYGTLYHRCICSRRLPATFFLNRSRLQAKCQHCLHPLTRIYIESDKICIPLIGGPSVGKTVLMSAMLHSFITRGAGHLGFAAELEGTYSQDALNALIKKMESGVVPSKTLETVPRTFSLALRREAEESPYLLHMYDASGESYLRQTNLRGLRFQEYLDGALFLVDPFSFTTVRERFKNRIESLLDRIQPSMADPVTIFDQYVYHLESTYGMPKTGKSSVPLAVIITKIDALGLYKYIGEPAVSNYMRMNPALSRNEISQKIIRSFFLEANEQRLLQRFDTRFSKVRFFACSALGRMPDKSQKPFVPFMVLEPLLWLLHCARPNGFPSVDQ